MLLQVLGIQNASELTYELIESLIANATPEGQRIEYKSELPISTPRDKHEFALDIAAIANAGGGLIVLGLDAENEVPVAVCPVPLGQPITALQQSFTNRIEPLVHVNVYERAGPASSNDLGVVVLEVVASQRRPFAVMENNRYSFCIRTGRHREHLTEGQLEQMYRDRFRRRTEVDQRLDELTDRASYLHHDIGADVDHGRIYVAAIPTEAYSRLFRPNQAVTESLPNLPSIIRQFPTGLFAHKLEPIFGFSEAVIIPRDARTGFKRIELAIDFNPGRLSKDGWIELHDDGGFIGVIPSVMQATQDRAYASSSDYLHQLVNPQIETQFFIDEILVAEFLSRLAAYWVLAITEARLSGEVALAAGVTPATSVSALKGSSPIPISIQPMSDPAERVPRHIHELDEEIATSVTAHVEDLAVGPALIKIAKVLLDDLFSAFGWGECLQLSDDGTLRRRYFSSDTRPTVERWATAVGVGWSDSRIH